MSLMSAHSGAAQICLRPNFAGIESARLYSETYFGTKSLVEDYLAERASRDSAAPPPMKRAC